MPFSRLQQLDRQNLAQKCIELKSIQFLKFDGYNCVDKARSSSAAPSIIIDCSVCNVEGGRIITIGSVTADRIGFPGSSLYGMTKAAVAALTRGLARDLGPRGITVNTVQPSPTETDMYPARTVGNVVRSLIALGRMGKDTEIASLVSYLAGPESSFVTGTALSIDGGYLA